MEFAEAAKGEEAHKNTWRAAKAMTYTAIDIISNPELLKQAKEEFIRSHKKQPGTYEPKF